MLKQVITYENFDGFTVEKECHFNLSRLEMMKMEREEKFSEKLFVAMDKIQALKDSSKAESGEVSNEALTDMMFTLQPIIESLVKRSYGVRIGDSFHKSKEQTDEFVGSGAYEELVMSLMTDSEKFVLFIGGVVPKSLQNGGLSVAPAT